MAADAREPLALKVMRLRRPTADDDQVSVNISMLGAPGVSAAAQAPKLILPMALTQSFVGESFTGYLHIANTSASVVANVSLKVELQLHIGTQTQSSPKYVLFNNTSDPVDGIAPGDFFDATVEYVLRDQGTYVLTCHVSYAGQCALPLDPPREFRRVYRFPALLPFAVVHRVAQFDSQLLVECTVENATGGNIYLAAATFEPVQGFLAEPVRSSEPVDVSLDDDESGDEMQLLKPRGAHSLLFRVTPKERGPGDIVRTRALDLVGSLSLAWHMPAGPSGRMESHHVRVRQVAAVLGLDVRVTSCPSRVRVEEPFRIELEVVNRVAIATQPSLVLDPRLMGAVRVHGVTQHSLGHLIPNASKVVQLDLLITAPGLHPLQGVAVVDATSSLKTEPQQLCDILAF